MAVYDAKAYGVVGDGVTKDTDSIQQAIDPCYEERGGRVRLEKGIEEPYRDGNRNN